MYYYYLRSPQSADRHRINRTSGGTPANEKIFRQLEIRMRRILNFLAHPALQGCGAIGGIAGAIITLVLAFHPVSSHPITPSLDPSNPPAASSKPPGASSNPSANAPPQGGVNDILNSSLGNIDETYRGVHQYFNDESPLKVIGILLIVFGIGAWVLNLIARIRLRKSPSS
jgi:hypothetical protein